MPAAGWKKMSEEEIRLARAWYNDDKEVPSEIAERLGRDKSVITRLLVKKVVRQKQGPPTLLTDAQVDFMVKRLDALVRKANCKYHVTADMLKRSTRLKVTVRTMQTALRKRNIYFRKLREKPCLTEQDIADRYAFAKKYRSRTKAWWNKTIHAFIDGKHFKVYLNKTQRERAAQHATFGAYRAPGKGLCGGYVKPKKSLNFNTGAKSALVLGGVGGGRMLLWHTVSDGRWSGQAAANMYAGPLPRALNKKYPGKRKCFVLEDNDPTGFRSAKGIKAKADSKIEPFAIPKRSPDLSVIDYAIWSQVNRRLRKQEASWKKGKKETRCQYVARLRRTAMRLPTECIVKSIGDMVRRCKRLHEAKGGYFEEVGSGGSNADQERLAHHRSFSQSRPGGSAMPAVLSVPSRRLRRKTWLVFEVVGDEEPAPAAQSWRSAAVSLPDFLILEDLEPEAHEDIARVIQAAFQNPSHKGIGNQRWGSSLELDSFVVFKEHQAATEGEDQGPVHWHVALRASGTFRFAPYKRALAMNHRLASHWSTSHQGYWSAVRYGFMPSPKKPQQELDPTPLSWHRSGDHPTLFEVSQEPTTVAATQRRRETKVKEACEAGRPELRPTEMDLYAVIVRHGFRNTPDDMFAEKRLIQHLKDYGSPALVNLAFKIRRQLPALIDDVWSWETVDDTLSLQGQPRIERLFAAAREACNCNGQWRYLAEACLRLNCINAGSICSDVFLLLRDGRRTDRPVLVLMGRFGGEGKSIYGQQNVQATPQPGSFPLLNLETKKVVLMDEWAFDSAVVPLPTQLLWYEGKPFPLTRPQNKEYSGHLLYQGSAPIFVTCKEKDLGPLICKAEAAVRLGEASEQSWKKGKKETRCQYVARLRRTAMRLPTEFIVKSIGDMVRRCKRLHEAKGGYFEEGGKRGC
ncbi:unnamed protein product [Polarella glacialis]|uniref:Transposase Tc1-like domain-containing protein n=1 Tax=Polarella glacialis TaxID=89957 RepID=A0A813HL73_POLGL|nr:unnamed protein product [Polarella glacialis]